MLRRTFLATGSAALAAAQVAATPVKLGVDLFSIRDSGFTPFEFLDYSAKLGAKVVHFSEIRFIGSLEDDNLRKVKAHAEKVGIEVELGMRSICPSSAAFDAKAGTAEEQLARMFHAANMVGSKIVRCFLGTFNDRNTDIDRHIEDTVKVLRNVKSKAQEHNVKIAIENHAGDMQARELKTLIEESGKDFVGACLDSGNPMWAIEDPHLTLETLHPYVLTSHIRDSAVWKTAEGSAVQWTRMGEGNVDIERYVKDYARLCPGKALSLEIIVTGARKYPYLDPKFWSAYKHTPAWEFSRYLALAERGTPRPDPAPVPKEKQGEQQRADLETSMQWTRRTLGLQG